MFFSKSILVALTAVAVVAASPLSFEKRQGILTPGALSPVTGPAVGATVPVASGTDAGASSAANV